jgi:hypothetical protein
MNILSIRETLKAGSASNAERQLAQIAHDQGDETLALLVKDLTPGEVATFLEEGDYSKPSEVTQHLTSEQFMEALARFGAKWGKISKDDGRELLLRLKEDVATFILPTLLHREDRLFIKAMLDDTLGEDIIVALPLYETGYLEFLREFDSNMAQKGTWQELYAIIQEMEPKTFRALRKHVYELSDNPSAQDDDEEADEEADLKTEGVKFLRRTLQRLSDQAAKHAETSPEAEAEEDVFRGI